MSQSVLCKALKSTGYANASKVSHGDWRDDRPPHGRGGRASQEDLLRVVEQYHGSPLNMVCIQ
ncbi:hypothetical protein [Shewanella sp. HN-41]|uniref:hypothetical protein n=1 Tax=Shewanella sp. HN-41 TaxID=327275 RepID=UPI000A03EF42|nr:hypothetical protein [Shewanella sp. HN-41]